MPLMPPRSQTGAGELPVVLTIAGSDSGGGAGIQADLLTFAACGVFGTSAITCLTAQNPDGVSAVQAMPAGFVAEQIAQIDRFFQLRAVKTGMLFNAPIIDAVAAFLAAHPQLPAVLDPVMVATSGAVLLEPEAIAALHRLLPLATLITPNLDEAGVLLGHTPRTAADMHRAGGELASRIGCAVLLKGGHLEGSELTDLLVLPNGDKHEFTRARIDAVNTHGSGCTLASAIAAGLACGRDLAAAVAAGLAYVRDGMVQPLNVDGRAYIRH
jgi:hydroxymethylpyrimidine/phosphomethylpyrimidine kinase